MSTIDTECVNRMVRLGLPQSTIDNFSEHEVISVSDGKSIRALNTKEYNLYQILKTYPDIQAYHTITFSRGNDTYTAFLITTQYAKEWQYEFMFCDRTTYRCFALVFKNDDQTFSRDMLVIKLSKKADTGLLMEALQSERSHVFA